MSWVLGEHRMLGQAGNKEFLIRDAGVARVRRGWDAWHRKQVTEGIFSCECP